MTQRFANRKQRTRYSGHHKFWTVWFLDDGGREKRVAMYRHWENALQHVETAVRRFGRGHL